MQEWRDGRRLRETMKSIILATLTGVLSLQAIMFVAYDKPLQSVEQSLNRPLVFSLHPAFSSFGQIAALMDSTSTLKVLTDNTLGAADRPVLSPDSQQIAFDASKEDNSSVIYVMKVNGLQQRRVSDEKMYCRRPNWPQHANNLLFECETGIYI